MRKGTCAYQGIRNVSFSESFAYALNALINQKDALIDQKGQYLEFDLYPRGGYSSQNALANITLLKTFGSSII